MGLIKWLFEALGEDKYYRRHVDESIDTFVQEASKPDVERVDISIKEFTRKIDVDLYGSYSSECTDNVMATYYTAHTKDGDSFSRKDFDSEHERASHGHNPPDLFDRMRHMTLEWVQERAKRINSRCGVPVYVYVNGELHTSETKKIPVAESA